MPAGSGGAGSAVIAVYTYRDHDGAILFHGNKRRPHGFFYTRHAHDGTLIYGLADDGYRLRDGAYRRTHGIWTDDTRRFPAAKLVLYRLPEVRRAVAAGRPVFVVEGEKDVETLWARGIAATTNPMGAGKWRSFYALELAGAEVVIIPDNDEPGRRHAHDVLGSLTGIAAGARLLELSGLPEHGDVSDWFAGGGTADELLTLADLPAYPLDGA